MDPSEYLGLFLDESREGLQALNASLLDLERDPSDREALAAIFRAAHSLKGMSATMGFASMARLTHRMEEVLAALRDDGAPVTGEVTDTLFACLDVLQEIVDAAAAGDERRVDAGPVLARLDATAAPSAAVAEAAATVAPPASGADPAGAGAVDPVAEALGRGLRVLRVRVDLADDCLLAAARALMVARELGAVGELVASEPSAERMERDEIDGPLAFWIASDADAGAVRAAVARVSEIASCEVDEAGAAGAPASPARPGAVPAPARPGRPPATVRVGTDRLDALMDLMGEVVIQRTRLSQLAAEHDLPGLTSVVQDLSRVTGDLQALVMQVRMTPVEAVFMRFPRMVRDLARSLGKRVELVVSGEDTELDRTVVDGLGDPLVHMLRNSLDHGLEAPAEREAAGKPATGTIRLSARHAEGGVVIEVRDDGRGMDPEALRASAVRRGLLDAAAARALSDAEALDLIFLPGFSTAARATDVSGRGVGMDAVRSAIAALGGEVAVASEPGAGTAVTVRLPLTLAIVPALLVRAGGQVHALPLEAIEEAVVVGRDEIRPVGGRQCTVLRGAVVPLAGLRERLGGGGPPPVDSAGEGRGLPVVVVRAGASRLGLVVDGLIGRQDVVIKRLPAYLGEVAGVSGAAVLGDGSVALIVDVAALGAAS